MKLNIACGIEIFYPEINGIITTTMNFLTNIKRWGHNPIIITPHVFDNAPEIVDNIPVYYIPSTNAIVYPGLRIVGTHNQKIFHILKSHNIDIVHTTAPWVMGREMFIAAQKLNISRVHSFHTNLHEIGYIKYVLPFPTEILRHISQIVWKLYRPFIKQSNIITAPDPLSCEKLIKQFPKKRVEWIPNGLDISVFSGKKEPTLLKELIPSIVEKKMLYALFIGRIGQEKSIDVLIHGAYHVKKQLPHFQLVLVGAGPHLEQYQLLARTLHLEDTVHFLGKVEHNTLIKSGLLSNARVFTTASVTETQSMTVTEAISSGTPTILANHNSMTYLAGSAGCYFPPFDAKAWAKEIVTMFSNELVYAEYKANAVQRSHEFDGEHVAQQYLQIYMNVLQHTKKH